MGYVCMHHYSTHNVQLFATLLLHLFGSTFSPWCSQGSIFPDCGVPSKEGSLSYESSKVEPPLLDESLFPKDVTEYSINRTDDELDGHTGVLSLSKIVVP